jgi:Na+-translocating ferredoxin:NAD+ oxidoreductase RnfG subunit
LGGFWRTNGSKVLVVLAVLSLVGAGAYGQLSYSTDVEPFLTETLPDAASFELLADMAAEENYLYGAVDATGMPINYVTASEGQGYGGPMTIMVVWTLDGIIQDVQVAQHNDTAAWFGKLTSGDFYSQYIGREYSEALKLREDIDAASGATRSSAGVATAVANGRLLVAEQLGDPFPVPEEPIDFDVGEIALLVGLGMVFTFRMVPPFNRYHRLRIFSLAFGFVVFGVWLSSPLSLVNFAIWPVGFAPTWQSNLFLYILVGGLVTMASGPSPNGR